MKTVIIEKPSEPQVVHASKDENEVEFRYQWKVDDVEVLDDDGDPVLDGNGNPATEPRFMEKICRVTRPNKGKKTIHDHEGEHARLTVEWATGS